MKRFLPNIILIVLDTVRYDYWIGEFNNMKDLSSLFLIFNNAFSTATWTPPSHASIFTGKYPHQHGIISQGYSIPPLRRPGLAYHLLQKGYITFALISNPVAPFFIGKGFMKIIELDVGRKAHLHKLIPIRTLRSYNDPDNILLKTLNKITRNSYYLIRDLVMAGQKYYGAALIDEAVEVILNYIINKLYNKKPFFLFINYMDAHDYLQHTNLINRWLSEIIRRKQYIEKYYKKGVKITLDSVAKIIKLLEEYDILDETIIIITSDHGELIGEYGLTGHGLIYPYNELIHVPLAIYDPLIHYKNKINKIISIKDIFGIILQRLNGQNILNYIRHLPNHVIVEDRGVGIRQSIHYRTIIMPPYKIIYNVSSRTIKFYKIYLEGYEKYSNEVSLKVALKLLQKINKEAELYSKLKKIKFKIFKNSYKQNYSFKSTNRTDKI